MQIKAIAPSRQVLAASPSVSVRKEVKASLRHLAGAHRELAMADPAGAADMAVDRHIVGRVGEDQVDALAAEQPLVVLAPAGVAADQPVTAEQPEVAHVGDGRLAHRRDEVLGRLCAVRVGVPRGIQGHVDLSQAEAGEFDLEVEIDQRLQLDGEQLLVPAGVERQLVVGEHIGPPLRLGEVGKPKRRHPFHADQLGGGYAPMTGDDFAVIGDQHRVDEAEALILSAICLICFLECRRALRAYGFSAAVERCSTAQLCSLNVGLTLEARLVCGLSPQR